MPSFQAQIICFGHDETLLNSRKWLFKANAIEMDVVTNLASLRTWVTADPPYPLAILCHSLEPGEAQEACHFIRRASAKTKVLELVSFGNASACDVEFPSFQGPKALLGTVFEMLGTGRIHAVGEKQREPLPFRKLSPGNIHANRRTRSR